MATHDSTAPFPGHVAHQIQGDANEVELMFHAIGELVSMIGNMSSQTQQDERNAALFAISKMTLVGVGTAGRIARHAGGQPFGMYATELAQLVVGGG